MDVLFNDGPWSPGVPIQDLPGDLPLDVVPKDVDLAIFADLARHAFERLDSSSVLTSDALWHDMLAVTGEVRTHHGSENISRTWHEKILEKQLRNFSVGQSATEVTRLPGSSWVRVPFTFQLTTQTGLIGNCSGTMCFVPTPQATWKLWVLCTVLENHKSFGHPDIPVQRNIAIPDAKVDFSAIIVGAGQAGLSIAGRLQALGITYLVLERSPRSGNSWVSKYDTVRQHSIREVNHLPFGRTWDGDAPDFLPAAEVTDGFERWVQKHQIDVRTETEVMSCTWDDPRSEWTVKIQEKERPNHQTNLTCRHLLMCTGIGLSRPRRPPVFPGEADFEGRIMHVADYKNGKPWKGQRGLVIGSGTAAHDIADDMYRSGLESVTMTQRTKTAVYPMEWYSRTQKATHNKTRSPESADRLILTLPLKINTDLQSRTYQMYVKTHKPYFQALERAGFKLDFSSTPNEIVYNHFGGYYIDIGTSSLIANGQIKLRNGITIDHFSSDRVIFSDGSSIPADIVVFATAYEPDYRQDLARLVGSDIASQIPKIWGVSPDGDLRGIMKECAPGLWVLGGAAAHARFFSRFIALQIQEKLLSERPQEVRSSDSRL